MLSVMSDVEARAFVLDEVFFQLHSEFGVSVDIGSRLQIMTKTVQLTLTFQRKHLTQLMMFFKWYYMAVASSCVKTRHLARSVQQDLNK